MAVRLQSQAFDAGAEITRFSAGRAGVGAVVSFTGICRDCADSGAPLMSLTLDHYAGMAEAELDRLEADARRRWPLADCLLVHRFGRILPGEPIVLVVTLSAHRAAAFAAADFLMDWLKTSAPFWKREETADGKSWVAAKVTDDDAAERWGPG